MPLDPNYYSLPSERADFPTLIAKIRNNAPFDNGKLRYEGETISDGQAVQIAEALRGNTSITGFNLRGMDNVGDEGATALAKALEENPRIAHIDLSNNAMTDASAEAWAKTIGGSHTIRDANLAKNNMTDAGQDKIFNAIIQGGNPNLTSLWTFKTNPPLINSLMGKNRKNAWDVAERLITAPDELNGAELRGLDLRINSVVNEAKIQAHSLKVDAKPETFTPEYMETLLAKLPRLPEKSADMPEALFTSDERGYAPLDNPRLWESPESARNTLDGLRLDKDLLERKTAKGSTLLAAAAHAMGGETFVEYANGKGIKLNAQHLLDAEEKPTPLLVELTKANQAHKLFTAGNWAGSPQGDMQKVLRTLPDHLSSQVQLSTLTQEIRRSAPQQQGIGR